MRLQTQNFTHAERILPHLNAAVFLLQNRLQVDSLNSALRGFLFEVFCYFFALTAYSLGPRLALSQARQIFNSPFVLQCIQKGHVMGTSQHLFMMIFRISHLAQSMAFDACDIVSIARSELSAIEKELSDLEPSARAIHEVNISSLDDAVTSEMYRLACLVYARQILDPGLQIQHAMIQNLLDEFMNQLGQLPPDSPSDSILCWPLVVAGLCATMNEHQRLIIAKLGRIHEIWQCEIFSLSAEFLREKWRKDRMAQRGCPIRLSALPPRLIHPQINATSTRIWTKVPVILA